MSSAYEIELPIVDDERGTIVVPHDDRALLAATGHPLFAVAQCTMTRSARGVVRGVHYTATPPGSAKYVYCSRGRGLDIVVDLRVGSPTFGRCDVVRLDGDRRLAVYIPTGVGHAVVALEDDTTIQYMISERFEVDREYAVSPLDPELDLPLPPGLAPVMSERDRVAPTLARARDSGRLPDYETSLLLERALYADRRAPATAER